MATEFTCPLCGHAFDPAAHLACQTCPLHSGCRLVCCPACGHTTVDQEQSRIVRWITGLLSRASQPQDLPSSRPAARAAPTRRSALAAAPIDRMVRMVDMGNLPATQREQLHGYGLVPGRVLRVVQRNPVTVVQLEHVEVAIETELAQAVWVDELA
jgi:Fe2+ transport system protein FeoA